MRPITIVAEQLHRRNVGGIGTYAENLIASYREHIGPAAVLSSRRSATPRGDFATHYDHHVTSRLWSIGALRAPRGLPSQGVLHATSFHFPNLAGRSDSTFTIFVHDLAWRQHPEFFSRRGASFHEKAFLRAACAAKAILVPSRATAEGVLASGLVPSDRIHVTGEGADHLPPPTDDRERPARPYFLSVSTIEPRKNLDTVFRAYSRVRESLGARCPDLVIVGGFGWDGKTKALRTPAPEGARLIGAVSNQQLSNYFADALAFVYVPLLEGYGLPPIEAMHAGIPVVVSDAVPSVVERPVAALTTSSQHDVPAVVCHALDDAGIADALRRFADSETMRAEYAARGTHHVGSKTWVAVAQSHSEIWEHL